MAIKDSLPSHNNGNSSKFSSKDCNENYVDDEASNELRESSMKRNLFWESQEALLQEIVENYKLSGIKVVESINKIMERVMTAPNNCECNLPKLESCAKCLKLRAVNELSNNGFTATLCTSKWNRTHQIFGGRHDYIEVMTRTTQGRKKQVPLLIELNFRDEFKMAKSCEEYFRMVNQLPEIYIGKVEYLNAIVRVMCEAY